MIKKKKWGLTKGNTHKFIWTIDDSKRKNEGFDQGEHIYIHVNYTWIMKQKNINSLKELGRGMMKGNTHTLMWTINEKRNYEKERKEGSNKKECTHTFRYLTRRKEGRKEGFD